jgi:hypothetical protein
VEPEVNCKPGDLAIVVRCAVDKAVIGQIVKTKQLLLNWREPVWVLEEPLRSKATGFDNRKIADSCLRPIRDNDKEDETLTWAPRKETA